MLYKKIERKGVVEFVELAIPSALEEQFETFILKDKMIDELALYLANSTSGKSYKQQANEIVNLIFMKENI